MNPFIHILRRGRRGLVSGPRRLLGAAIFSGLVFVAGSVAHAQISTTSTWVGTGTTTTQNDVIYGLFTGDDPNSAKYANAFDNGNWSPGYSGVNAQTLLIVNHGAPNDSRVWMNQEFWVDLFMGKIGQMELNGGTMQLIDGTVAFKTSRIGQTNTNGQSIFTQNGGTFYMNAGEFRVGANGTSNGPGDGLFDLKGGVFSTAGGLFPGGNVTIQRNAGIYSGFSRGEWRISGTATVDLGLSDVPDGAALGFGPGDGSENSSILSIIGSTATINIDSIRMATNPLASGEYPRSGVIQYSFDETGVSPIHLNGGGSGLGAVLTQGYLDLNYTGTGLATGTVLDLITGGPITLDAASFSLRPEDTTDWEMFLNESSDTLQVRYLGAPGPGGVVFDIPSGTSQTQAEAGYSSLTDSNALSVTKTGAGTVVFDAANSYTGPTQVSAGTLRVTNNNGLSGTAVTVETGGTLALPQDARVTVAVDGLAVDQAVGGGLVDLGGGQVSIAAGGITATDLRADIIAGRNGGAWNGTTGITSATAATSGGTRAVGYLVAGDGSATVSFAAPGDTDLNGSVNVFDLVSINSSGKYGTGTSSVWSQGDFNYDGVTNVFDLVGVNSAGAYGQGNYFPAAPTGLGSVAAVPEPATWLLAVCGLGGLFAARGRRRL